MHNFNKRNREKIDNSCFANGGNISWVPNAFPDTFKQESLSTTGGLEVEVNKRNGLILLIMRVLTS